MARITFSTAYGTDWTDFTFGGYTLKPGYIQGGAYWAAAARYYGDNLGYDSQTGVLDGTITSVGVFSGTTVGASLLYSIELLNFSFAAFDAATSNNANREVEVQNYLFGADDLFYGSTGNDTIDAWSGNDIVYGGTGDDQATGGAGDDTLFGGEGNDSLSGGAGNNWLVGGIGNDTLDGGAGHATVEGGAGDDRLSGGGLASVVTGEGGNDQMGGGGGDDTLDGGAGNDTLSGGGGNNVIDGGAGIDQAYIDIFSEFGGWSVGWGLGGLTVTLASGTSVYRDVESFMFKGSVVLTLADMIARAEGTPKATAGPDLLDGTAGNDLIDALAGADTVHAGDGQDTVFGGDGPDQVWLGGGDDVFEDNTQGAPANNDTVWGGAGNDQILGGNGFDVFYGDAGADYVRGGKGFDTLFGGDQADTIDGNDGNDVVYGGKGSDLVNLGTGADLFWDVAQQANGNDRVFGGGGWDTIHSAGGADTLTGGAGADSFVLHGSIGAVEITDFVAGEDRLRLASGLWGGALDQTHLDALASVHSGALVLSFDGGGSVTLDGVTSTAGLLDDIFLF